MSQCAGILIVADHTTDDDGKLLPLLLLPGDYVITATAPGYKPWKKTVRITSGSKQAVEIALKKE